MNEGNQAIPPLTRRKCHDCGRPTVDYHCGKCLRAWREKHCVENRDKITRAVA